MRVCPWQQHLEVLLMDVIMNLPNQLLTPILPLRVLLCLHLSTIPRKSTITNTRLMFSWATPVSATPAALLSNTTPLNLSRTPLHFSTDKTEATLHFTQQDQVETYIQDHTIGYSNSASSSKFHCGCGFCFA